MGMRNIRLGSTLSFDEEKEKDILEAIDKLNSCHKTGQFMSNLIRTAFDCPDKLEENVRVAGKASLAQYVNSLGVTEERAKFFNELIDKVDDMKKKVDTIYDMTMKTYMLAQMGKHIGLEQKSDSQFMAEFLIEKQLNDLKKILGASISNDVYASNKLVTTHEQAENYLEFIAENYSGIIDEIRKSVEVRPISVPIEVTQVASVPAEVTKNNDTVTKEETAAEVAPVVEAVSVAEAVPVTEKTPVTETVTTANTEATATNDEDELIDFGEDLSALSTFFGLG